MDTDIDNDPIATGLPPSIHVVLVETSHPGNIGAAARAMKTMGLDALRLVVPKTFPSAEATALASGADDVLARATVHESLAEAVADCTLVMAASARLRSLRWPVVDPRGCAAAAVAADGPVAIVFGREKWGLSNDELALAHHLVVIPANPAFSSLNLAMAVQLVAYELRMALSGEAPADALSGESADPPATSRDMALFYEHLERVATSLKFLDPENPRHLMRRFRRLFNRARPDRREVNILRGLLSAAEGVKLDGAARRSRRGGGSGS